jgi:hypothetical protein
VFSLHILRIFLTFPGFYTLRTATGRHDIKTTLCVWPKGHCCDRLKKALPYCRSWLGSSCGGHDDPLTSIESEGKAMDLTSLIVQAIGGAAGGAAGGKLISGGNMGQIGNLIAGAVGGVGGGSLLGGLLGAAGGDAAGGMDIGAIAGQLVGGGIGGLVVQTIVGMIKNKLMG